MQYHKYRFGLKQNIKVWLCRRFGHRLNDNPTHQWCGRCGLAYSECYHPVDYATKMFKYWRELIKESDSYEDNGSR